MLRACRVSQPCRLANVASSSSSAFHTSAVLSKVSEARLRSRALKKENLELREKRRKERQASQPSVILGTRPGQEHKWRECRLGQLLVDETVFTQPPQATVRPQYGVEMPEYRAFGVAEAEAKLLFAHLPDLSWDPKKDEEQNKAVGALETFKATNFARVIDLRNSDAGGISYENRRRIIVAFSTPENPFDTGRTEVQVAILTYRIRKLYAHLRRCKHDLQNKLSLRKLVHQRAKLLKYLKRTARVRYDNLLAQIGVEPEAVEGELVVN
ncbi:mitochondrial ribosomal protein S15 [Mycena polygramma]|nr:mitochondrial ribosomal protein S15 [Mycena polygramma]